MKKKMLCSGTGGPASMVASIFGKKRYNPTCPVCGRSWKFRRSTTIPRHHIKRKNSGS